MNILYKAKKYLTDSFICVYSLFKFKIIFNIYNKEIIERLNFHEVIDI